jgi:class 3 adenylate cyclase
VIRFESRYDIAFPREAIWPVLSRTDWLNRSLGLPPVEYDLKPAKNGGSSTTAHSRLFGLEMRWQELPFEWLEPEFHRVRRIFETGPFLEVRIEMQFQEQPGNTTQVIFSVEIIPRNALGKLIAGRVLWPKAQYDMQRAIAHLEKYLHGNAKVVLPKLPTAPVNESALLTGLQKLRESGQPEALISRLEKFLRESPDVALGHIRPLAVAREWETDPWETLRLFLHAPGCGLLDLSWEILCPNCRSTRQPATSLAAIRSGSHCDVCQIAFDAEFDKSVELKFSVNAAIRPTDSQMFCLAGPGGRPHVVSQLYLEPNGERLWKLPAPGRSLRLGSPQIRKPVTFEQGDAVKPGERLVIQCGPSGFRVSCESASGRENTARIHNPNPFPVLLVWELTDWSDTILTAARVTNWQEFRDLFASEVISPTERVTVGSQVILFTDLRGSTAMYQGLGDAPAYARVRNHFSVLTEVVREQHGAVVKTIGDAVIATFSRVDEALEAVRQMHGRFSVPDAAAPLVLKSSLHVGPCLAVNANNKLDYFGSNVNLAARMVGSSKGGDLIVSDELFHRPETTQFLSAIPKPAMPAEVQFRGFDEPHRVWRIEIVPENE